MPVRVLVVDDSNFFQHRLKDIINEHPDLKVIGIASNGREAVEKAAELKPDIITMDFEMPVMDGVTAIKLIMANRKVPILMFSSLTYEGAKVTLDALAAGALDFIPKDFAEVSRSSESLKKKLHERLITLAGVNTRPSLSSLDKPSESKPRLSSPPLRAPTASTSSASASLGTRSLAMPDESKVVAQDTYRLKKQPKLLVIGASTGGPVALAEVLTTLPANFPLPIVLVQHMPENFTKAFAERLNKQCNIRVREAVDG